MVHTKVTAGVHVNDDTRIALTVRAHGATSWLDIGDVTVYLDDAGLERLRAALAPVAHWSDVR